MHTPAAQRRFAVSANTYSLIQYDYQNCFTNYSAHSLLSLYNVLSSSVFVLCYSWVRLFLIALHVRMDKQS